MPTLLVKNALVVVTMDETRREIANGALFVRDNVIEAVGSTADLPATADEVLDLTGHVVLPGLVNTHHHMYQTLTRVVPGGQNEELFDWLRTLYPIWAAADIRSDLCERQAGGGGTGPLWLHHLQRSSLHLSERCHAWMTRFAACGEVGLRFHATRGSMSVGRE